MSSIVPPNIPGIYKITCTVTGKFYIGSAISIQARWRAHKRGLITNTHHSPRLQHAWNKYGAETFTIEMIEQVDTSQLIEREQYYLDALRSYDDAVGFNICSVAGSTRGCKASEVTRAKLRARRFNAEVKSRLSEIAHNRSPEHRRKIGIGNTRRADGRHVVTTPDGAELVVNLAEFCREHKLTYNSMCRIILGKQKIHKGYTVRRATDPLPQLIQRTFDLE